MLLPYDIDLRYVCLNDYIIIIVNYISEIAIFHSRKVT